VDEGKIMGEPRGIQLNGDTPQMWILSVTTSDKYPFDMFRDFLRLPGLLEVLLYFIPR